MKISVIIGAFNRPGRLRTFLASLIDQTFTDFEAVVTDNSTDPHAIEQQRMLCNVDSRIRYEHTGERAWDERIAIRSLYTAAEIGVSMTTGEWLSFPNDDGYFVPWYFERMIKKAEDDNLEFVYCDLVHGRPDIAHYALNCQPWGCALDKTNFMFKRAWMPAEWPGKLYNYGMADGDLINLLVKNGIRHGKLGQLLVVHN